MYNESIFPIPLKKQKAQTFASVHLYIDDGLKYFVQCSVHVANMAR
jgi:hypothetical protein